MTLPKTMYPGMVNSPETTITNNINESDTIIYVLDPARVPEPPNLMTLGTGTNAETVLVTEINDNAITVERGFQGVAKSWSAGTIIARNFTAYDYDALRENIEDLETSKETPAGAQAKADAAQAAAEEYADAAVEALAGPGNTKTVKQVADEVATHLADYVRQPGYAAASGSANAYTVTLSPAPTAYTEGMAVSVKINVDNTGASTINVNGLGAKTIKKPNGNDVSAGNLKAGSIYTLRYNGTNFILQGSDAAGNATPADVLSGKTFTNDQGEQTGTMPNRGTVSTDITTKTQEVTIAEGYHSGSGKVKISAAEQAKIIGANIKSGVTILGVPGELVPKVHASGTYNLSSPYGTSTDHFIVVGFTPKAFTFKCSGGTSVGQCCMIAPGTAGVIVSATNNYVRFRDANPLASTVVLRATSQSEGVTLNATVTWEAWG